MDAEGLKSLLWFLVFGGLFFVMMRYGCGAHIGGHRHGGHRGREGPGQGGALETFLYGIYFGLVFAPLYSFFHGK